MHYWGAKVSRRLSGHSWQSPGVETAWLQARKMAKYVDEAFVVLVHIYGAEGRALREEYVVGCPTRDAAEDRMKRFFPPETDFKVFASPLGASETEGLDLLPDEVRPWP